MKKPLNPTVVGAVVALVVVALAFFGFRSVNASNVHSYDEGTPEQRAALSHSFGPHAGSPPAGNANVAR